MAETWSAHARKPPVLPKEIIREETGLQNGYLNNSRQTKNNRQTKCKTKRPPPDPKENLVWLHEELNFSRGGLKMSKAIREGKAYVRKMGNCKGTQDWIEKVR